MNITINISANSIAVISAVISVFAMMISLWQAFSAHSNLKINKQIYNDGKPHFTFIDIVDSYAVNNLNDDIVHLKFFVFVINQSDKCMVIKNIRLRVVGEEKEVILNPSESATYEENVKENSSLKEWIQFDIGRDLYENIKVIKYTVLIQDSYGNTDEKSVIIVREEVTEHEEKMEKNKDRL